MSSLPSFTRPGLMLWLITGLACVFAVCWLWIPWCGFPNEPWNDLRIAAAVALQRGFAIYPTLNAGVVNTWTYGPLPLLLMGPAALAPSAAGALMVAGALNILSLLGAIVFVSVAWPGWENKRPATSAMLLTTACCVLAYPELTWRCFFADNAAVALGLVANLLLMRASRRPLWLWAAAFAAMAPLACKQTSVGVALAQVIWLFIAQGRSAGGQHLCRLVIAGALIGLAGIGGFGWSGLWFVLVELPARFAWVDDPWQRLTALAPQLCLHVGVPGLVMLIWRRAFWSATSPLLLPALTWTCALLPGLTALMKLGGGLNSLQSFLLWLPPVLACLFTLPGRAMFQNRIALGLATTACLVGGWRLHQANPLHLKPLIGPIRQAEAIAAALPGQVWFPLNPLVTLYSDNQYYDDEDGIYVRFTVGRPLTYGQVRTHLPLHWSAMACKNSIISWGIADHLIPPGAHLQAIGAWKVYHWPAPAAPESHPPTP